MKLIKTIFDIFSKNKEYFIPYDENSDIEKIRKNTNIIIHKVKL